MRVAAPPIHRSAVGFTIAALGLLLVLALLR